MNDLPSCQLASEIILNTNDTVIYYLSTDLFDLESKLNSDLATISNWFSSNLLTLNISKCNFVIFGNSRKLKLVNEVSLKVNSTVIDRSDSLKYLGVVINQTMSWSEHIDTISTKINQRIGMIKRIRHLLPLHAKLTLYSCLNPPPLGGILGTYIVLKHSLRVFQIRLFALLKWRRLAVRPHSLCEAKKTTGYPHRGF